MKELKKVKENIIYRKIRNKLDRIAYPYAEKKELNLVFNCNVLMIIRHESRCLIFPILSLGFYLRSQQTLEWRAASGYPHECAPRFRPSSGNLLSRETRPRNRTTVSPSGPGRRRRRHPR